MKGINENKNKHIFVLFLISIVILSLILLTIFLNYNGNISNTLNLIVISENDDGRTFETVNNKGYGNEPDDWANLQVNPSYSFGIRFVNVSIPQGSKIINSYVRLYSIGIPGHNKINCLIYADNVDNALNFSEKGCLNRSGRNYTQKSINWNADAPYKQWVVTPSINSVLNEIINRSGWKEGNAIALLFITKKTVDSAVFTNYGQGNPAEIYIEWE